MTEELHLIVIWSHALPLRIEIEREITECLKIRHAARVTWSPHLFSRNLQRFYGINLPAGANKEAHCGNGPFIAYVVSDSTPRYAERATSKGNEYVNVNLFDLKLRLRAMSGGGHRIHATNNQREATRDIWLIFQHPIADFLAPCSIISSRPPADLNLDIPGVNGWASLKEVFTTLNHTCTYLVLRNFDLLPETSYENGHGDIDLLTDDVPLIVATLGALPVFPEHHRVHFSLMVGGQKIFFDFRSTTDLYYDFNWSEDVLRHRVKVRDLFYTPAPEDHFYTLLYHALIHKPSLSIDYAKKLASLAPVPESTSAKLRLLASYLRTRRYFVTKPTDHSVYFNEPQAQKIRSLHLAPVMNAFPSEMSPHNAISANDNLTTIDQKADKIYRMQQSFSWKFTAWLRALRRAKERISKSF